MKQLSEYVLISLSTMSLFDITTQVIILTFGVTALFLSQLDSMTAKRAAPIIGLLAEPFWLYTSYNAGQWGVFCLGFVYIFVWLFSFYKVWIRKSNTNIKNTVG